MPTITQLEYILAVYQQRHFGKAAKVCHVSQPSLSMQIQKVEDLLGFLIFDRNKKPIIPTEKGQLFLKQAKNIIREHKKLLDISKTQSNIISGEFKLGIIPTLAPYTLPLFIEQFSLKYPDVQLLIDEMKTEDIIAQLKEDELDAGILATPLNESSICENLLFYEPFYLYISADHPLQNKKKIKESDLIKSDLWLLQDGHCLRNQVINFCSIKKDTGVFKNISFEGGNLETLRYLIKKTKGSTLLPHLFVQNLSASEKSNYIKEFTSPAPTREISIVFRRDQWKLDIIRALESIIKKSLPKNLTELDARKTKVIPF